MKPEESKQWEAGTNGLTEPLDWRLSAYHYKTQNLIGYKNNQYVNAKSAMIKGLEWTDNVTAGPVGHCLILQYADPQDDDTNKVFYRQAEQQVKYELTGQIQDLGQNVAYQYIGECYDNDYDSSHNVKLGGVNLRDIGVSYLITSQLTIRGEIADLFDKDYETVYGYAIAGREYALSGSYIS